MYFLGACWNDEFLQYLMVNVLLCVTGSVAAIKTQQIVEELQREFGGGGGSAVAIKVAVTERAKHFLPKGGIDGIEVMDEIRIIYWVTLHW